MNAVAGETRRQACSAADVCGYAEASRLLQLAKTFELIVSEPVLVDAGEKPSGLEILDGESRPHSLLRPPVDLTLTCAGMQELCEDSLRLILAVKQQESQLRARGDFDSARELFEAASILDDLSNRLSRATDPRPWALAKQSLCPVGLGLPDCAQCLDADFLFHFEFDDRQVPGYA